MSRKLINPKFKVLTDADSTTNPESIITEVSQMDTVSYEFIIGATVKGDFSVEYNNDKNENYNPLTTDWKPLNFGQVLTVDGSIETLGRIEITDANFQRLKLKFTNNAGTGLVNSWVRSISKGA